MPEPQARVRWWAWTVGCLVLSGVVAALVLWGLPLYRLLAHTERVRAWVTSLGPWGPAAVASLQMAQVILAPIPGQAIGAVSGYLYGPWLGTLYAMVGTIAGSLLLFFLARQVGRPVLRRLLSPNTLNRLDDLACRGGAIFFFLVWLTPFTPDDLACLAAAVTPMRISSFLILMTIGRLPGVFVSVWVGAHAAGFSPTAWVLVLVGLACGAGALWRWSLRIEAALLRLLDRLAGQR